MATDNRSTEAKSQPPGPGDEDWDKAQAVIHGEVDPTAPDKTADDVAPNTAAEAADDKK